MSLLLGILIFVLALLFSIMLHEAGHLVTAKKFGMKVTQFFVGFGPTLWSRRQGRDRVRRQGDPGRRLRQDRRHDPAGRDVDPADEPRSFRRQPGWQRTIVMAAGSFMHFVLAFVLLFALAIGIGLADRRAPRPRSAAIDTCVPSSADQRPATPVESRRRPAKQAGIRAGDKIIAVAGSAGAQLDPDWARRSAGQPAGTPVTVTVQRGGQRLTLTRHPGRDPRPSGGRTWASHRSSCSSGPGRWAPSPTRAASSARSLAGSAAVVGQPARGRSRTCSPRTARRRPGRPGDQRGRRRGRDRPGGRRPDRLAGPGRPWCC